MEECKCLILGLFWIFKFDFSFDEVEIEKKNLMLFYYFLKVLFLEVINVFIMELLFFMFVMVFNLMCFLICLSVNMRK